MIANLGGDSDKVGCHLSQKVATLKEALKVHIEKFEEVNLQFAQEVEKLGKLGK